ncbi:MAG: universal stress protein [Caldimicrobium sp.]
MYKKILYPIKFEEFSLDILSCILNFKKAGTEEIILLHVIDVTKLPMDKFEGLDPEDIQRLTTIANTRMEEAINMIIKAGLSAKKRIEVGIPYREILRVAKEEAVSLIVSGRQKKSLLDEIFIGSNTDKIIRYGNYPVFIPKYPGVFGGDREACERYCSNPFAKVLYPTDWSACAKRALLYLKNLKNAGVDEVIVVHVMEEKLKKHLPQDKFKDLESIDKEKLAQVKEELEQNGFKVKTILYVGKPGADLIKLAKEEDVTLIIMGAHGKGFVEGILWGSVSRNVVEYSDRPVLLIKGENC